MSSILIITTIFLALFRAVDIIQLTHDSYYCWQTADRDKKYNTITLFYTYIYNELLKDIKYEMVLYNFKITITSYIINNKNY